MKPTSTEVIVEFADNQILQQVVGSHDAHLHYLEDHLNIDINNRGNLLSIHGSKDATQHAKRILESLYEQVTLGHDVSPAQIDALLRLGTKRMKGPKKNIRITTRKETIFPRSPQQSLYMEALACKELIFGIGPAGTGKTFLAVAAGVSLLLHGKVDRLVISRPAVEAGERLGFLPGDLKEKVDPYLRPIYDSLHLLLTPEKVSRFLAEGTIEVAPLAFMRGRTLNNAFIILDEAQNTTVQQMKMFLTRMGVQSYMVITGDPSQIDLPRGEISGLTHALHILEKIPEIARVTLTEKDIVRHPLVSKIVQAYEQS